MGDRCLFRASLIRGITTILIGIAVVACAPQFNKKMAKKAQTLNQTTTPSVPSCNVQSPGTTMTCPVHASADTVSTSNTIITDMGANKVFVVCRSTTGLCAHVNGSNISAAGGDPAATVNSIYTLAGNGYSVNSGDG